MARESTSLGGVHIALWLLLILVLLGLAMLLPHAVMPSVAVPKAGLMHVRQLTVSVANGRASIGVEGSIPACTGLAEPDIQRTGTTITLTYRTRPESTLDFGPWSLPQPVCDLLGGVMGRSVGIAGSLTLGDSLPPGRYIIIVNGVRDSLSMP
jgi:hypothetical protein